MKTSITHSVHRLLLLGACLLAGAAALAQNPAVDANFQLAQLRIQPYGSTALAADGTVNDVVRQPDGKYIVGGNFDEINGVVAKNIARLLPDGTPDATFTASTDARISTLLLQPDGKILVGGYFTTLSGGSRVSIGRLFPNGTLDATFAPPTSVSSTVPLPNVRKIALQSDGSVLIGGDLDLNVPGGGKQVLARLNAITGQKDAAFTPAFDASNAFGDMLVLPDDKIIVGGGVALLSSSGTLLTRLQPNGTIDNTFTKHTTTNSQVAVLASDRSGNIYASTSSQVARYLPDGTLDASFGYSSQPQTLSALAVQPNGRLLVGSDMFRFTDNMLKRLLPDGSNDASFVATLAQVHNVDDPVNRILVQPDGAIVVAGRFTVSGVFTGLVRLNATNVLAMKSSVAAEDRTAAWPVPAHEVVNLSLDAASRPRRVQLLDALGRPVRTLEHPAASLALPLAGLAAGTYQLRVEYAEGGNVVRRVLVQ